MRHSTSDLNKFEKLRKEKTKAAHAGEKRVNEELFAMEQRLTRT